MQSTVIFVEKYLKEKKVQSTVIFVEKGPKEGIEVQRTVIFTDSF